MIGSKSGNGQSISSLEVPFSGGVNLVGCQLVSPCSKEGAITAAHLATKDTFNPIDWRGLFNGLEAAGFIRFEGGK